eukprot:TRINITY_DN16228_c0_g1::TRINITY_DN16228_c0_g1_i1::g.3179::m.3179 TRINITY_DN16228_c0_g1::TRINITY_DN16228_c0_g1_i1::g.3179  ORF type:complete len:241 (-),score=10.61,sp/Q9VLF6/U585_DROME/42.86/4e-46,DUF938/PF06080.7/6.9e-68,Methyltransf_23/PF13489.1/0.00024,Methyltransf_11/PF08241.7/0.039,Methyltransf_11/PF08241.7/1.6e+03,Methyltransf_12/PF08242.7/0.02,Methyltransf_25/PF13649.1/0.08,Methyltransf_18/PF12847.2/0.18 TRINITY_DN16228_c0_g1_i1:76-741(-)
MASQMSMEPRNPLEIDPRKQFAPSADRNRVPILEVLQRFFQSHPPFQLLEIASGTGQHASFLSQSLSHVTWQPTEYESSLFESIKAYCENMPNVKPPIQLDVSQDQWQDLEASKFDAMLAANLCHISPILVTHGLLRGASRLLNDRGYLFLYGPFKVDGKPTTESNEAFDTSLRQRNQEWGLRDIAELECYNQQLSLPLRLVERIPMPANNFTLVFQKIQQ